jgi:hypothetical protein
MRRTVQNSCDYDTEKASPHKQSIGKRPACPRLRAARGCASFHALQLLPRSPDFARNSHDGRGQTIFGQSKKLLICSTEPMRRMLLKTMEENLAIDDECPAK